MSKLKKKQKHVKELNFKTNKEFKNKLHFRRIVYRK